MQYDQTHYNGLAERAYLGWVNLFTLFCIGLKNLSLHIFMIDGMSLVKTNPFQSNRLLVDLFILYLVNLTKAPMI